MTSPHNLFERLGGMAGIENLVSAYVQAVKALPAESRMRQLYGEDMTRYRERMIEFLSGWLGGPPIYLKRHGMPMLRETHRHFGIDESMRDEWMHCMRTALSVVVTDPDLRLTLEGAFWRMSDSLRRH